MLGRVSNQPVASEDPDEVVRRARWATAAMFATNGAVLAGLLAAPLVARYGSARVAVGGTLAVAANLVVVGAAPSWLLLVLALGLAGALDSVTDIAENAQGLRVERRYGRAVLNSMHATWSIGAVVGGTMGSVAAGLHVPLVPHLAVAAVTAVALALVVRSRLLPGADPVPGRGPGSPVDPAVVPPNRGRRRLGLAVRLLALAVVGSMAQGIEDLTSTWSALYLRDELGAAAVVGPHRCRLRGRGPRHRHADPCRAARRRRPPGPAAGTGPVGHRDGLSPARSSPHRWRWAPSRSGRAWEPWWSPSRWPPSSCCCSPQRCRPVPAAEAPPSGRSPRGGVSG